MSANMYSITTRMFRSTITADKSLRRLLASCNDKSSIVGNTAEDRYSICIKHGINRRNGKRYSTFFWGILNDIVDRLNVLVMIPVMNSAARGTANK